MLLAFPQDRWRAGHDLDQAFAAAIPAGDLEPPPARFAIDEALGEGRLALADRARPADGACSAAWRWVNSRASRRRRVIMQSRQRSALSNPMAAKLASVTAMMRRSGSQRTS